MNAITNSVARLMEDHGVSPSDQKEDWTLDERNPNAHKGDCTLLLPSYQPAYMKVIGGETSRHPSAFPRYLQSPHFLNPLCPVGNSAFHWPNMLYSIWKDRDGPDAFFEKYPWFESVAGALDSTADTGGYHVADYRYAHTVGRRINAVALVEAAFKWGMCFDVPPFKGRPFAECIRLTVRYLQWLLNNRHDECTKWFVIFQGQTLEEARAWYTQVEFGIREGLTGAAYAVLGMSADIVLTLIRQQLDGYLFDDVERLHFLGHAKATDLLLYTAIKRLFRKHLDKPDFEVTADTSTAFRNAGRYSRYYDGRIRQNRKIGSSAFGSLITVDTVRKGIDGEFHKLRPDTQVWLNSPINPYGIPMKLAEVNAPKSTGDRSNDPLSMSILATSGIFQQVWHSILAQREADAEIESYPIVHELKIAVEEILFGDRPDEALRQHHDLLKGWFQ